jgi:hypothetical protein
VLGSSMRSIQNFPRRRDPRHRVFAVLGEPQKLSNKLVWGIFCQRVPQGVLSIF